MKERNELVICLLALNSIPSLPCLALFCREPYPASCLLQNPAILPTDFQLDPSSGRHWHASGRWRRESIVLPLSASCWASDNGNQFWQWGQRAALGSSGLCSSSSGIRRLRADADSDGSSELTPRNGLPLCPVVLLAAAAAALWSLLWVIPPSLLFLKSFVSRHI